MVTLLRGSLRPCAGDLVLARVLELGKQTKLELTDGRRAHMFPGDEIVVCYGNRYAPDQFEAQIGEDLSPCDLVAAGGIASIELSRHQRMPPPTRIRPLGLLGDDNGRRLNVRHFKVAARDNIPLIPAVLSLGTSMNAGKTLTAMSMVRGLKRSGYRVAALKVTGTGAGGDMWIVRDAGADVSLDFTDAGFASTYLLPLDEILQGTYRLLNHAHDLGCDVAVIEVADGLHQRETAAFIQLEAVRAFALGTVFAAYDAMGAKCGVDLLRAAGHKVFALSGRLGRSPLGVREAEHATGLRVYSPWELQEGALVPIIARIAGSRLRPPTPRSGLRLELSGGLSADGNATAPHSLDDQMQDLTTQERKRQVGSYVLTLTAAHVMTIEVDQLCGAGYRMRNVGRKNQRNGFRKLAWNTAFGMIQLNVPRLRSGSYFPRFALSPSPPPLAPLVDQVLAAASAHGSGELVNSLANLCSALGTTAWCQDSLHDLSLEIEQLLADFPLDSSHAQRIGYRQIPPLRLSRGLLELADERDDDEEDELDDYGDIDADLVAYEFPPVRLQGA
jgi:hypothetical protein